MRAILIHGLGRTPLSMMVLAARLNRAEIRSSVFGYVAAAERYASCVDRLRRFIDSRGDDAYILVGHSLGAVLIRAVLPHLCHPPAACFLIAPPNRVCRAARAFAPRLAFRLLAGEMGQRLASERFMDSLAIPNVPTTIYAGTRGPVGRWSPFGGEANDGVVTVSETRLGPIPVRVINGVHTFLMNKDAVVRDIIETARALERVRAPTRD
jgi:hypothetical protein